MLSISPIAAAAADAYADYQEGAAGEARSREDYYAAEGDAGQWSGELAAELGLSGPLQKGELLAMLRGFHPKTGEPLASNAGDKHKPGWDLTFSAPKSVSVIWALCDPQLKTAIDAAQKKAVAAGLDYLQANAFSSRDRGDRHEQITEILAATYAHGTSREGDPQLHTHCAVGNLGKRADGTFCALDFDSRHKMAAGAIYRAELAAELQRLGFAIEASDKKSFRIAGVPDALCKDFSQRRAQIEARMEETGLNGAKAAAAVTLRTRRAKEATRAELEPLWRETGAAAGFTEAEIRQLLELPKQQIEPMPEPKELLREMTQQASTFTPMQLRAAVAVAAQGRLDAAGIEEYMQELERDPQLVHLVAPKVRQRSDERGGTEEVRYTSREMLDLERSIVDRALARKDEATHHVDIAAAIAARPTMSDEQRAALAHITQQTGGVAVIEGMAGTGKSYLMGAARDAWESAGFTVRGAALAGKAAQGLQQGSGIPSQTLHSLLAELAEGKTTLGPRDVVVLDEAGMVGSRQMAALMAHVHRASAKVVLVGDSQQLQPIDAGGSFRALSERLGHASLTDIRRQADEGDRAIVKQLAAGRAAEALEAIRARGLLHAADDRQAAMRQLVADWHVGRDPAQPGEALMLAGTRAEVRALNDLARETLRDQLAVETTVETAAGSREFAEGDRILFTRNSAALGVKNGTLGTLLRIEQTGGAPCFTVRTDGGEMVQFAVGDPETMRGAYHSIDHGYAVSVHKAQGVTVDRAYVLLGEMADREWGYVAASRARESTQLYTTTEAAEDLNRLLARSQQKDTSLDYQQAHVAPAATPTTTQHHQPEAPAQPQHETNKETEYEHE